MNPAGKRERAGLVPSPALGGLSDVPSFHPGSISTTASPTIPKPSAGSTSMRAASSRHSPPR